MSNVNETPIPEIKVDVDKVAIFEKWVKSKYASAPEPVCKKYELVWIETAMYEQGRIETLAKEGVTRSFTPAVYGFISNEKKLELLDEAYLNLRSQIQLALEKEKGKN